MTGSFSTNLSTGSKPIISGSFAAVAYAENILRAYDNALLEILHSKAKQTQEELRENARNSSTGWADIADYITVEYHHDERQIAYTIAGSESIQDKAMNLEYGNGQLAPSPLLRTNILRQQDADSNDINESLRRALSGNF